VVFVDALMVKIRDGVVANRPVSLAIGIDCDGAKQVLGLWVGPATGESGKFWLTMLSELMSRGVAESVQRRAPRLQPRHRRQLAGRVDTVGDGRSRLQVRPAHHHHHV
jgi:hypothetical protein